jgi:hypothetical protein
MALEYQVEWSRLNDAVWIHASDGSTVGRFGKMGVDLHNTVTEQMQGAPECRLCTHGRPSVKEWDLFREKAAEWWGVSVPKKAFNRKFLMLKPD